MRRFDDEDEPEDLTAWLAAGLRRPEARVWRRWNFQLNEALTWRKAGVREALTAAQWQAAGATPATVGKWIAAGITPSDAVRWHEFGYTLEQASEHVKEGRGPAEAFEKRRHTSTQSMRFVGGGVSPIARGTRERMQRFMSGAVPQEVVAGYIAAQWLDDEAYEWATQGVQVSDAKIWRKIGLVPAEAKDLSDPLQVIEDWWRAGIPYDEVADWLGAGLTAAEAIEQRAAGVTREQAAALRALRRGGG
jgi:hypothetical protein